MSTLADSFARLRSFDLEARLGLTAPYPPVVIEIDREQMALLRLKTARGGSATLEALESRPMNGDSIPSSIFQPVNVQPQALIERMRELFEVTGTKPGKVSVVLPDNLAKISLIHLPERPGNAKQLDELVRAKMRRAVPFRLEEASLSYQLLSGEGRSLVVLVVLVRKQLIERIEGAIEACGARPGLIDLATPNLYNLCRDRLRQATAAGKDAALLNCARNYFSLVIVRDGIMIFYRCKTFAVEEPAGGTPHGVLAREVMNSLSYYREKLEGQGVSTFLVRSADRPVDEVRERLSGLGIEHVEAIDALKDVTVNGGVRLDDLAAQQAAPSIAAAKRAG